MVRDDSRKSSNTFLKFLVVGGLSTILNYALFYTLLKFFNINHLVSSSIGYIAGVFLGFYLNKVYTFDSNSPKYGVELIKYFIIYSISLIIGLLVLDVLTRFVMPATYANMIMIGFTTIMNYIGSKYLVFSRTGIIKRMNYTIYKYRYFLRYVLIGVFSIVIELIILIAIFGRIPYGIALVIAFFSAMIVSYIINLKLNFNIPKDENLRSFIMFAIFATIIYFANLIVISYFSKYTTIEYSISRIISSAIFFSFSYLLHRKITFKNTSKVGVAIYLSKDEDVKKIKKSVGEFIDWIHLDIVDETIREDVKEIDIEKGYQVQKEWPHLKKMTHIMSKHPLKWIDKVAPFSDYITIHLDVEDSVESCIGRIKKLNKKVGICLMAKNSVKIPKTIASRIDLVQILGIDSPGESGQKINPETFHKLELINKNKKRFGYKYKVCVDGGIKKSNSNNIHAEYIVSGSAILNSNAPRKTIYQLKTHRKRKMDIKETLTEDIFKILNELEYVKSGSLVGSFVDKENLDGIGDIDTIVIVDKLTKKKYDEIISKFKELSKKISKRTKYNAKINPTFGPIKYNEKNLIVFHLMIYDIDGHINHCIKSPFTCLEWQRTKIWTKSPLLNIWGSNALQPNYFFNSRRSIRDYMKDLEDESISFREYKFGKEIEEIKKAKQMTNKDKFEFAYHIMKFCMLNFLKLHSKKNIFIDLKKIKEGYFKTFPLNEKANINFFNKLSRYKSKNKFPLWNSNSKRRLESFLKDFEYQFEAQIINGSQKILFMRHQETKMSKKGVFLGQHNDPSILKTSEEKIKHLKDLVKENNIRRIVSSPLKRTKESAKLIQEAIETDELLLEINYGKADGLNFNEINKEYPYLIEDWNNNLDPRFPEGENTSDVEKRTEQFFRKIRNENKNTLVVTHNVFMRTLLGRLFRVNRTKWHQIRIPHLEPIEVIKTKGGKIYPNLTEKQISYIFGGVDFS